MKSTLRISLKSGERIFVNGAVLRVDRKVAIEFLNDVTFLLENHVLQPEDATTPLRQLYFIAQMILINPEGADQSTAMFRKSIVMLLNCFKHDEVLAELKRIDGLVTQGRAFEALKAIRGLYPIEDQHTQRAGTDACDGGTDSQGDRAMAVSGVNNTSNSYTAHGFRHGFGGRQRSAATLNYESFLKLLVAQMKNQDPTQPMDATQQIAQLATFSQVEQTIKTNSNLESLLASKSLTAGFDLHRQDDHQQRRRDERHDRRGRGDLRWRDRDRDRRQGDRDRDRRHRVDHLVRLGNVIVLTGWSGKEAKTAPQLFIPLRACRAAYGVLA